MTKRIRYVGKSLFYSVLVGAVIVLTGVAREVCLQESEIKDNDIYDAVVRNLDLNEGISSHLTDVSVEKGIVILSGSVDNILAKERSAEVARAVKGVRSVVNEIEVEPVVQSDNDIRKNVVNALTYDPVTELYELDVEVENGYVVLDGTVDSWNERKLVEKVVKNVKGIKGVEKNIDVKFKAERLDSEIKADIERQLEIDPYVRDGLIEVIVNDGKVRLEGTVGSAAEKRYANWDCWVSGVKSVDDSKLEVKWWMEKELIRKDKSVI